jgi:pSer/pThr/pTyr-binding forkhead associated (FHA) protein
MAVLRGTGEFNGKVFSLDEDDASVGRGEGQRVFVQHGSVSQRHAKLWCEERWFVQDVGSRNGSALNGTPIAADAPYELREGDEVAFGAVRFRFDVKTPGGKRAETRTALEHTHATLDRMTREHDALKAKLAKVEADLLNREEALDEWERRMHEVNATWVSREDMAEQIAAAEVKVRAEAQRQVDAAVRRALEMEKRFVQATARVETLERTVREKEEELVRRRA